MGTPLGWSDHRVAAQQHRRENRLERERQPDRSNEFGDHTLDDLLGSISARPTPSLQFSFEPEYLNENGTVGDLQRTDQPAVPARRCDGGRPETYGRRYIFGVVDRTTLSAQFRVSYTFKPDVTLDVYAEPFAASGAIRGYRRDAAPRAA